MEGRDNPPCQESHKKSKGTIFVCFYCTPNIEHSWTSIFLLISSIFCYMFHLNMPDRSHVWVSQYRYILKGNLWHFYARWQRSMQSPSLYPVPFLLVSLKYLDLTSTLPHSCWLFTQNMLYTGSNGILWIYSKAIKLHGHALFSFNLNF